MKFASTALDPMRELETLCRELGFKIRPGRGAGVLVAEGEWTKLYGDAANLVEQLHYRRLHQRERS